MFSHDRAWVSEQIYWDVEWDEAEEKLNEIMAGVEQQADGLFKYQGRLLQMLVEGGGWFDCRRPPYYGTNTKPSKLINARQPLAHDVELDYCYESDADWSPPLYQPLDCLFCLLFRVCSCVFACSVFGVLHVLRLCAGAGVGRER